MLTVGLSSAVILERLGSIWPAWQIAYLCGRGGGSLDHADVIARHEWHESCDVITGSG